MKYFFCKFIPPREDFLATMTPEEKGWMGQHADYLNKLLAEGKVRAHGPVKDATGGFGLSIYELRDDESIDYFTSRDPIIRNGIGHYESYPMLHLKI